MRRLTRILLWTAGAILTLVLLAGVIVETPYFKNWLLTVIVKQANDLAAKLSSGGGGGGSGGGSGSSPTPSVPTTPSPSATPSASPSP